MNLWMILNITFYFMSKKKIVSCFSFLFSWLVTCPLWTCQSIHSLFFHFCLELLTALTIKNVIINTLRCTNALRVDGIKGRGRLDQNHNIASGNSISSHPVIHLPPISYRYYLKNTVRLISEQYTPWFLL